MYSCKALISVIFNSTIRVEFLVEISCIPLKNKKWLKFPVGHEWSFQGERNPFEDHSNIDFSGWATSTCIWLFSLTFNLNPHLLRVKYCYELIIIEIKTIGEQSRDLNPLIYQKKKRKWKNLWRLESMLKFIDMINKYS